MAAALWKTVFVPVKVVINIRVISDDLQFGGEPGRELRARSVPAVSATPAGLSGLSPGQ